MKTIRLLLNYPPVFSSNGNCTEIFVATLITSYSLPASVAGLKSNNCHHTSSGQNLYVGTSRFGEMLRVVLNIRK